MIVVQQIKMGNVSFSPAISRVPALSIPILMYHEVAASDQIASISRKTQHSYILLVEQFASQMQWMTAHGFTAISLNDLLEILLGLRTLRAGEKPIIITFDDGFAGNYLCALPILQQFQLTATFFVIVNRIGQPFYMSWPQLEALIENGMQVQSHTMTHVPLGEVNKQSLIYELKESKDQIEQKLQTPVSFISLPHGSYGRSFKEVVMKCGYWGGCTSDIGYVNWQSDPFLLPRISVNSRYDLNTFAAIVESTSDFLKKNLVTRKIKKGIRKIVREKNYNRVYHFIYGVQES